MAADQSRTFSSCGCSFISQRHADGSRGETVSRRRNHRNAVRPAISCNFRGPTPGRRKPKTRQRSPTVWALSSLKLAEWFSSNAGLFFIGLWCFMALCSGAVADRQHPSLQKLASKGGLLVDHSDRPEPPFFQRMQRRDNKDDTSVSSSSSYAPIQASTATLLTTNAAATSSSGIVAASPTALPQVFDSNIGNNFTSQTCPTFFESLMTDDNFQECYPLSLLITESFGFFQAEKSLFYVTQALDASCSVNYPQCNAMMNDLALQIQDNSHCGYDLRAQNPLVQSTLNGLLAYSILYSGGCLKDDSGNYCFANAVTNSTTVADAYPYYLPLGTPMPGAVRPTCNTCLRNTMNIFAGTASNQTQPISQTYVTAAQQVDLSCGPNWVTQSVKTTASSSTTSLNPSESIMPFLGLTIFLITYLL